MKKIRGKRVLTTRIFQRFLLLLLIVVVLFALMSCGAAEANKKADAAKNMGTTNQTPADTVVGTHPSTFVGAQDLQAYLAQWSKEGRDKGEAAGKESYKDNGLSMEKILAGVAPHHLVAGKLIAGFFSRLAPQNPPTLILVGPNHTNKGAKVITGLYAWQTPEGPVQSDENVVRKLLDTGLAVLDEEALEEEHSVGTLLPFARHYLPQSKVVPVILHHDVSLQDVDSLLRELQPFLEQGAVLVASVDFSHYLKRQEAESKDETTLALMRELDYTALSRLDSDYLDSPASLFMALRAGEKSGIRKFSLLEHTNSGILLNNDSMETTSYFTLVLQKS